MPCTDRRKCRTQSQKLSPMPSASSSILFSTIISLSRSAKEGSCLLRGLSFCKRTGFVANGVHFNRIPAIAVFGFRAHNWATRTRPTCRGFRFSSDHRVVVDRAKRGYCLGGSTMRAFLSVTLLFAFVIAPSAISAQTSVSGINVGAHGNDYLIGTWTCHNSIPSAMGGPSVSTFTASRSDTSPPDILIRATGSGFDASSYLHYDAKTQTWWSPSILASGAATSESSSQTGKTTVWAGTVTDASGTSKIRDTFVQTVLSSYSDTTEIQSAGAWKTVAKTICTKS